MKILERINQIKIIGNNRRIYSDEWLNTHKLLIKWAKEYNLDVKVDVIGNIFCRLVGYDDSRTIGIISHYDSVENGGAYDGIVGVLGGLETLSLLGEKYGKPEISIELICIAEEEGARFKTTFLGSRTLIGALKYQNLEALKDEDGVSFFEARRVAGLDTFTENQLMNCQRNDIISCLELHIEQSKNLDELHIPIGVCKHIPGQMKIKMTMIGEANHAGTTTMFERKDALCCAAKIISFVEHLGIKYGGITTTGYSINVQNATNVIPSHVELIHDMRHHSAETFNQMLMDLQLYAKQEEERRGVKIEFEKLVKIEPSKMSEHLNETIHRSIKQQGLKYIDLNSEAGYDVQIMESVGIPSGLIFIPSRDGISHRPEEFTEDVDIIRGVNVLTHTIKSLAY